MNHLVVFAHPNPKSFCKGILDTVVKASEEKGASVRVRDLYDIGFDPVLRASDFEAFSNGAVPEDIAAEQEDVKWADAITFIYPVWWSSFPAMLKGYVDKVFSFGFAYGNVDGTIVGLLKGKKAFLFSTTGSPNEVYASNGMHNSMKQISDQGIFNFCGIDQVTHTFFGSVPYVDDATRKGYLAEVEKTVKDNLFS
ncbi:MAG: NAD(P)H-dependent oxidoreductase [Bacillota bacterium]|nr:NAD(P)H-dependent oxidoreductase [Bacillota bacterium]